MNERKGPRKIKKERKLKEGCINERRKEMIKKERKKERKKGNRNRKH